MITGYSTFFKIGVLIIISISLLFFFSVSAEKTADLKVSQISIGEGLSQNTVNTILQDNKGFLWFGTQDGLNRYDGYDIKVYRSDPSSLNSISSGYVTDIVQSQSGEFWIGTQAGINKYNPETEQFTRYLYSPHISSSLSDNQINDLYLDKKGRLWIATDQGGLNLLDTSSGIITSYQHNPDDEHSLITNQIWQITEDPDGNIWLGTPSGLECFSPDRKIFRHYYNIPGNPQSLYHNQTIASVWDEKGFLWVLSPLGIDCLIPGTGNVTHYLFEIPGSESGIGLKEGAIIKSSDGTLWIGTRGSGLRKFDPDSGNFTYYPGNTQNLNSIQSNAVRSLLEDSSGAIWIGTDDSGVYQFNPTVEQFTNYKSNPEDPTSLSTSDIFGIYEDNDGILWIGGADGNLNRFDRKNNTIEQIQQDAHNPHALAPNRVLGPIIADKNGTMWMGTGGGEGLFRYNSKSGDFTRYSHDPNDPQSISDNDVICVYEDKSGAIWAGTKNGLNRLDTKNGTNIIWKHDPDNPKSISSNDIWAIYEDNDGTFLIGTFGAGLDRLNLTTGTFTHFVHDPNDIESLSDNQIITIFKDRNESFWIGTGNGLNKFDGNQSFQKYTTENGLPNGCIYGIIQDDEGKIWVSTNNGIASLDPASGKINAYSSQDGLASDEHNSGAFFQSPDGEIFFGGISGITAFYPEKIKPNPNIPPVVLTNFLLSNKPVQIGNSTILSQTITYSDGLTLSYLDNVFSIEFSALNYANPNENRYRYQLTGFEQGWNDVDSSRRIATYTNMRPGRYVLTVQASNDDGIWNTTGVSLPIEITPPWWETWLFRSICLILIIGIIYSGYRFRIRSLNQRNKELQDLVKVRTMELETAKERAELANRAKTDFLSSMSHELRTPLNAILGYAQILGRQDTLTETQKKQVNTIRTSGEHLLKLITDILNMGRIESRKIELETSEFSLRSMIQQIINIIRVKTDEKGLTFLYDETGRIPDYVQGDERKIEQIILNLLTNAVRYTFTGSITFSVSYSQGIPGILKISITDTGVGIPVEKQKQIFEPFTRIPIEGHMVEGVGLGLSITKELIELMKGTIQVESEVGKGSTFSITLPLPEVSNVENISDTCPEISGYEGERCTVLVVDDHIENAGLLVSFLEPLGFKVQTANSGDIALQMMKQELPSLLLLDYIMPGIDGYDVLQTIKESPDLLETKVIGISATLHGNERKDHFVDLCDDFIEKPVRFERLLDGIATVLGITWIKETRDATISGLNKIGDDRGEMKIPPSHIIDKIRDLVQSGDYRQLENILSDLRSSGDQYPGFCKKIEKDAAKYDELAILTFLESFNGEIP